MVYYVLLLCTVNVSAKYFKNRKKYFMDKKNEKKICIDCGEDTDDYYPLPTNRGKIHRCSRCHENWVRNSTRIENSKTSRKE